MKKIFLLLAFLWTLQGMAGSPFKSHVDECFELTSIAFRLAGAQEYTQCPIPGYAHDIDSTFAPFKEHKLIPFIQQIRDQYGVAYNAVSNAAACLEIKNGKVVLKPGIDISKVRDEVDPRWTPETFKTFLRYLNDFYKKSNFRDFYTRQAAVYSVAEKQLDELLADINTDWFESVFGEKIDDPIIIPSLTNGPSNYAFTVPGNDRFGIAIGTGCNQQGNPAYNGFVPFTIIHEFLHKYANPRIDDCWPQIDSAAQQIYSHVQNDMRKIAYGSAQTTMTEWFVNLLAILYVQQHPDAMILTVNYLNRYHQNIGFIWMERSMLFMQHFLEHRDKYPFIDDFMPQIVNFVNYTAANFEQVLDEFNHRQPYVVDVFPLPGSTVDPEIDTIVFRFSEPMIDAFGTVPANDTSILSPPTEGASFWKDDRTFIRPVKKGSLQKGKTYGFYLLKNYFQSRRTYAMKEDLLYTFKVAE